MNSKLQKLAWFGVSTAILALTIYFADLNKFLASVKTANPLILAPSFVFGLAVFPVWAYIWMKLFTKSDMYMDFIESLKVFMAGFFMNSVTPLGQFGGEPLMAYLVKNKSDTSYERAISAIFSADVVNSIPVITFSVGGLIFAMLFRSLNNVIIQGLYVLIIVVAIGYPLMYMLWFESSKLEALVLWILRGLTRFGLNEKWVEAAQDRLDEMLESFQQIGQDKRFLFSMMGIAHLGYFFQILCLYFILWSVGIEPEFTPIYFVFGLAGLSNFSPTPGGAGTFEAAMGGLITVFFPASLATGLTVAILFRMTTYWPGLIIGYFTLNSLDNS